MTGYNCCPAERLPAFPDRECDVPSIGRDGRAADDMGSLATPQLRAGWVGEFPDILTRASCRNIEKRIRSQPGRGPRAGGEINSRS